LIPLLFYGSWLETFHFLKPILVKNILMNASVKSRLPRQSNDFASVEAAFRQTTACALTRVGFPSSEGAAPRESVTIVIPSYNGWRTLPATLDTLDSRLYRNFEIVIVDDGSTVPPAETLASRERSFPVKYLQLCRRSQSTTFPPAEQRRSTGTVAPRK
jgi:cellulose synthase/poly-beta-1,6-N-acetylglucosamine synthase-like glycosyltransferase